MIRKLRRSAVLGSAALAGAAVALFAGLALARTTHTTLRTAHISALHESVAVDSKGFTVYVLKPETTHHLLCKSASCFSAWPPVKVSRRGKLTKVSSIKGKLGRLHRGKFWQLTLSGEPLYQFSGDGRPGQANGEGIMSFGGTWHVVKVSSGAGTHSTSTGTSTTTTTTSSSCAHPPYCY